jgi:pseudouridine-5'-phosphate glycosidase
VIRISEEVRDALEAGRPVVALESTLIAHGLPRPRNLDVARTLEADLRGAGVVPATVAVLDGVPRVGIDDAALERLADPGVAKLGSRDLPVAAARGVTGATTVASTAELARRAGVRVFATGGLGGVHRGARESFDESGDLMALARTPIVVVSGGVKSILDVPATLERLETLGVTVVGYRTDRFPGFYLADSGMPVDWRVDEPAEVAAAMAAAEALGSPQAIVVANPIAERDQLDPDVHAEVLAGGLAEAERRGIRGKAVTPFLLDHFHRVTEARSLEINVAIVRANAALAGAVASAWQARAW